MTPLQSADALRRAFIEYFEAQGHLHYPSSSLVPEGDPTLLFTSAGMVQMKPFFLGQRPAPANRLCTSQKCFRTVDIDVIGNQRTLTFFEMLGNFSVGDYFKEGAIRFAWEFITQRLQMDANRVWVTVFPTDDEAYRVWTEVVRFPPERIVKLEDNWWSAGDTGPCGPDSELYFDRGFEHGNGDPDEKPGSDSERFLEFWNLVFMQYDRQDDGTLVDLPTQNIDTGMGLERLSMLMQGVQSVYDTDLFRAIMRRSEELANVRYGDDPKVDFSLRVLCDHSRAVAFLAADGVLPGSEGRGYVMRRILRRAIWHGRRLGLQTGFMAQCADAVIELMGHAYPELIQRRDAILSVIASEERRFGETLEVGLRLLNEAIEGVRARGETVLPGAEAFRLHDTYGFPIELTLEVAEDQGIEVDRPGFDTAMERQREQAKQAARFGAGPTSGYPGRGEAIYAGLPATQFVGYETTHVQGEVVGLFVEGEPVEHAREGQEVEVVLDRTPFYAESGGQIGDRGELSSVQATVDIRDTRRVAGEVTVHYGQVRRGVIRRGEKLNAAVEPAGRVETQRNHTATHLLHEALHQVLGPHALQRGSLVAPDRLRFDFSHGAPMTAEEIVRVERIVNEAIRRDFAVEPRQMPYREAIESGATALFGDKYRDVVRVVDIPGFSKELCGGTHVARTGEIGFFKIVSESSAAAGIRRIEAVTGLGAEQWLHGRLNLLDRVSRALRGPDPEARIADLHKEIERLRRELALKERGAGQNQAERVMAEAKQVGDVTLIQGKVAAADRNALLALGDDLKARLQGRRGLVVLAAEQESGTALTIMATKGSGIDTTKIIKGLAPAGVRGGGRPGAETATGSADPARLDEAFGLVPSLLG